MEKLLNSRPILTILMIVGSSPLFGYVLITSIAVNIQIFPIFLVFLVVLIIFVALTLIVCIKNIERVGYKKVDILRLVVPYYGIYFAYFLAKRFTMSESQLAANPGDIASKNKQGNGLAF